MFCPFGANSSCVADSRTWPMLPGRGLEFQREDRLNRIDDQERRLQARDLLEDPFEAGFGEDVERRAGDAQSLAAQFIWCSDSSPEMYRTGPRSREMRRRLEQQRRFADARLAADEHQRSRHDAAAEHAIELADSCRQPLRHNRIDVGVELGTRGRGEL